MTNALIIGCGQMGFLYLQKLLTNTHIQHIDIVEPDNLRRQEIKQKLTQNELALLSFYGSLKDALAEYSDQSKIPGICFIASNTMAHKENLLELTSQFQNLTNPPLLFIEKPLVENIQQLEELEPVLTSYKGKIAGGYLIRYSPVLKEVFKCLQENKLQIQSISVKWTKDRKPDRPSPGVLIDETTHTMDLILSYILPNIGFAIHSITASQLKGIRSNRVVHPEKQQALYPSQQQAVLADLTYQLQVNGCYKTNSQQNMTISVHGHSSFISTEYERSIQILCNNGVEIVCKFDINKQDHIWVFRNGINKISYNAIDCDKIALEINQAVNWQLGLGEMDCSATLADMIADIRFTHLLECQLSPNNTTVQASHALSSQSIFAGSMIPTQTPVTYPAPVPK